MDIEEWVLKEIHNFFIREKKVLGARISRVDWAPGEVRLVTRKGEPNLIVRVEKWEE